MWWRSTQVTWSQIWVTSLSRLGWIIVRTGWKARRIAERSGSCDAGLVWAAALWTHVVFFHVSSLSKHVWCDRLQLWVCGRRSIGLRMFPRYADPTRFTSSEHSGGQRTAWCWAQSISEINLENIKMIQLFPLRFPLLNKMMSVLVVEVSELKGVNAFLMGCI